MTTLKSTQTEATFISDPYEQGANESNWTSYTPSYKGLGPTISFAPETTNTALVINSATDLVEGDPIIVKDGTSVEVIKGTLGAVSSETSTIDQIGDAVLLPSVFSGESEASQRSGIAVSPDGTQLYLVGYSTQELFQYTLSTPYDIGTAVYSGKSGSILNGQSDQTGMCISNDGVKVFVSYGGTDDNVAQFTLSTPFDISTISSDNIFFSFGSQDSDPQGMTFSNDGARMFIHGQSTDTIYQYDLSTPYDVSTASYNSVSFSLSGLINNGAGLALAPDGSAMYVADNSARQLYKITLSTPFDVSTASVVTDSVLDVSAVGFPRYIVASNDGLRLYVSSGFNGTFYQYNLGTTVSTIDISSLGLTNPPSVVCRDSLPRMFTSYEQSPGQCLSQNIDLSYESSTTSQYVGGDPSAISDLLESGSLVIPYEGTLPTPISRASIDSVFPYCTDWTINGVTMSPDGTTLYIIGQRSKRIIQYNLSTPYDISTAVYQHLDKVHAYVSDQDETPRDITFNNDGTKLYMLGSGTSRVYQYSLAIPYDIATLSYDNVNFSVAAGWALRFNASGTKLFIGGQSIVINQYTLSTPFDLSTATTSGVVSFNSVTSTVATPDEVNLTNKRAALANFTSLCFEFNDDGTKVYLGVEGPTFEANASIFPPFTTGGTRFGQDVAIDGLRVLVGAQFGVTTAGNSGSVYVYGFDGTDYSQIQFIEPPEPSRFGTGVSANNGRLVIGAPSADVSGVNRAGLVYVYDWNGSAYSSVLSFGAQDLTDTSDFGESVSVKGNRLVVGAPEKTISGNTRAGKIYVYEWNGSSYDLLDSIEGTLAFGRYGAAVAIDGNRLVVSEVPTNSSDSTVYVYDWNGSSFDQVSTLTSSAGQKFGESLALDGTRLLIGEPNSTVYANTANGLVYVYEQDGNTYTQIRAFAPDSQFNEFGTGVAVEGSVVAVGAPVNDEVALNVGKAYVYDVPLGLSGTWDGTPDAPAIDQYRLETAFDISTVVYEKTLSVASVDSDAIKSLNFTSDGLDLYVLGTQFTQTGDVFQYSLATPFEVDSGTYTGAKVAARTLEEVRSTIFNNDGTLAVALSTYDPALRTYSLSTPFDISTMVWTGASVNIDNVGIPYTGPYPNDIAFNNDGTKFYIMDAFGSPLHQFTLSTPYDVTTLTYDSVSYTFSEVSDPYNIKFTPDGTKIIVNDGNSSQVHQYSLSTPFDISTITYDNVSFDSSIDSNSAADLAFNSDGTAMYTMVVNYFSDTKRIHQYSLSSPYDLSTVTYDNVFYDLDGLFPEEIPDNSFSVFTNLQFNNDRTKFYISAVYNYTTLLLQYSLPASVDGDLPLIENSPIALTSTPQLTNTDTSVEAYTYNSVEFSVASQDGVPVGVDFSSDGTKMFVAGISSNRVYQYSLSTPFDISTASYNNVSFSISGQTSGAEDFSISTDGTKMHVVEYSGTVFQYTLLTAYDLSSVSYDNISLDLTRQETDAGALTFSSDGTKMYVAGYVKARVFQYDLSTPYDVSTATYNNVFFPTYLQDSEIQGIAFNSDGSKMFLLGTFNRRIYQYSLSTPYDILTASYDRKSRDVTDSENNPTGITVNPDNDRIYIVGASSDAVNQYELDPNALTLEFASLPYAPGQLSVPDRSIEHTTVESEQWVDDYIQTTFTRVNGDGRAIQYKFVADTDQEVIEARYDLTKIAPGLRDI